MFKKIKKHETTTDNPPIRIMINKTENRILYEIKTEYYLERLAPETMILKIKQLKIKIKALKIKQLSMKMCLI